MFPVEAYDGQYVTYLNDIFLDLWTEKMEKQLKMPELRVSSDKNMGKGAEDVRARG
jgi:hypothetical protein